MGRRLSGLLLFLLLLTPVCGANDLSTVDTDRLDHYLDGLLPSLMERYKIAGSSISVVRDGRILTSKAYGYADIDSHLPVEAESTLFRIGSVTKVFTWIAILQLHEKGLLDLDAPIHSYLDFEIPNPFDTPITLRHLATHTAGFEDAAYGMWAFEARELSGLEGWLKSHIPGIVRRPGTLSSYSNYGAALAGYIIQRVSGMEYEEYIESQILSVLGMEHTSVRQPPVQGLSQGYMFSGGTFQPQGFEYLQIPPAGAMSSSATDMALLMLDLLSDDPRLLTEDSIRLLLGTEHRNDALLENGLTFGMYETDENGVSIISHGGDTMLFHSRMVLLPDLSMGLFITCNSEGGSELGSDLLSLLLDTFAPEDHQYQATPMVSDPSGSYRSNRRSYTNPEKLFSLFMELKVSKVSDERILLEGPKGPEIFLHQGDAVFRGLYDSAAIRFDGDLLLHIDEVPMFVFEPVRWFESSATLLISLLYLFVVMLWWYVHRLRERKSYRSGTLMFRVSIYSRDLFFLLALLLIFTIAVTLADFTALMTGTSWTEAVLRVLPLLNAFSAVGVIVLSILQAGREEGVRNRVLSVSMILAALILIGQLYQWRFLTGRL